MLNLTNSPPVILLICILFSFSVTSLLAAAAASSDVDNSITHYHKILNNYGVRECGDLASVKLYRIQDNNEQSLTPYGAALASLSDSSKPLSLVKGCQLPADADIHTIPLHQFLKEKQLEPFGLVFAQGHENTMERSVEDLAEQLKGKPIHQRRTAALNLASDDDFELDEEDDDDEEDILPASRVLFAEDLDVLDKLIQLPQQDEDATLALQATLEDTILTATNSTSATKLYVNADILQKGIFFLGFFFITLIFFGFMHSLQTAEHLASNLNAEDLQKKIQ